MFSLLLGSAFLVAALSASAQTRVNDRDLEAMMRNLSADTKAFRPKFDTDIRKKSIIRNTSQAKDAVKLMETFARQTQELPKRFKKDRNGGDSFRVVQATAMQVDATISSAQLGSEVRDRWKRIRAEVNQIAAAYNMPLPFGEGQSAAVAPPPATIAPAAIPFASGAESHWLRISVFANVPIAGADIAVYDLRGKRIFQQAHATNNRGVYPARVLHLPRDFRVTATSDGSRLQEPSLVSMGRFTLSADVRNFDPATGIVYINPATSLAADVADKLPGHDLQRAQNLVRRYLVLPPNTGLGAAACQGPYFQSPYFSETVFLRQAGRNGGVDRFLNDLSRQAMRSSGPPHSFAGTRAGPVAAAAGFIVKGLIGGAFSWTAGQGIGWAVGSGNKPEPGATKKDIDELQDKLVGLQCSVDDLKGQIDKLNEGLLAELGEIKYQQLVVPAILLSPQVDEAEGRVSFYAQACPAIADDADSGSRSSRNRVDCAKEKAQIESQLNSLTISSSFATFASLLQPNGAVGHEGMLRLYSQSVARKVRFFRPADSATMQTMFDYWYSVQAQAANLKVENMHDRGFQNSQIGRQELAKFLGDANATPPTMGVLQTTFAAQQKLMFPAVPDGTVINTRDRTMWLTSFPVNYQNYRDCGGPPPLHSIWNHPVTEPVNINGLEWLSPTTGQVKALIDGWTGSSPNQWLIDQTRVEAPNKPTSGGFPNITYYRPYCDKGPVDSFPAIWTRDYLGTTNLQGVNYKEYNALNLTNGQFATSNNGWRVSGWRIYDWLFLDRELKPGEQYYWDSRQ